MADWDGSVAQLDIDMYYIRDCVFRFAQFRKKLITLAIWGSVNLTSPAIFSVQKLSIGTQVAFVLYVGTCGLQRALMCL